jgi:hypothetical protein
MRLSEDRIHFIAAQVCKELDESGTINFGGSKALLEAEIARVILEDLRIEEEIDREVVERIDSMKRQVPHGSSEWQAIYSQFKEEIARRKNYIY